MNNNIQNPASPSNAVQGNAHNAEQNQAPVAGAAMAAAARENARGLAQAAMLANDNSPRTPVQRRPNVDREPPPHLAAMAPLRQDPPLNQADIQRIRARQQRFMAGMAAAGEEMDVRAMAPRTPSPDWRNVRPRIE